MLMFVRLDEYSKVQKSSYKVFRETFASVFQSVSLGSLSKLNNWNFGMCAYVQTKRDVDV